jgi:hypothetical protein
MVRSCIQDLLDGSIDPESFTQRLHTLYKSQPHTSLVPFFKVIFFVLFNILKFKMNYLIFIPVSITTYASNGTKYFRSTNNY